MSALTSALDKTLLVFALEVEAQGLFSGYNVAYTGVGKVNAAYQMMRALSAWREKHGVLPELVLNMGTAGSSLFRRGTMVNCTQFIQRDMDVSVFGHVLFATPNEDPSPVFSAGLRCEPYPQGVCGSGDSFSTDANMRGWNVVDMEAYALAKVCAGEGVPFCCLKYISDGADGEAVEAWGNAFEGCSQSMLKAAQAIIVQG